MPVSGHLSTFPRRLLLLGAVFSFELIILTLWLDGASLTGRQGLTAFIGIWGAWILRGVVAFAVCFLTLYWLRFRDRFVPPEPQDLSFDARFLAGHIVSLTLFAFLSMRLYSTSGGGPLSDALATAWLLSGLCAILLKPQANQWCSSMISS